MMEHGQEHEQKQRWQKLHPKTKIALVIKPMFGLILFTLFMLLPVLGLIISGEMPVQIFLLTIMLIYSIAFAVIIVWAVMFYNRYEFLIGDDAVHINRGILWKRNVVIPYERIQHTSVTRGPVDIILGLHILNLFTAGTGSVGARFGGAASAFAAEGAIPGLGDPKPVQEAIMSKVRVLGGDGFGVRPAGVPGVPREVPAGSPDTPLRPSANTQDEILAELRRIREILERRGGD